MSSVSPIQIYTDGGSRGNPGSAASGFVVLNHAGQQLAQGSVFIGHATNNFAEYVGVEIALNWLRSFSPVSTVTFYLDSQLIVNQLNGVYKIKDKVLQQHALKIHHEISRYPAQTFKFVHIPRELNSAADSLVNIELDRNS